MPPERLSNRLTNHVSHIWVRMNRQFLQKFEDAMQDWLAPAGLQQGENERDQNVAKDNMLPRLITSPLPQLTAIGNA